MTLSYLMQNRIRDVYEAFIRNNTYEDFSSSIGELVTHSKYFETEIDGVEKDDDNRWTILQLAVKKGRHDFVEKMLQGNLPIIITSNIIK